MVNIHLLLSDNTMHSGLIQWLLVCIRRETDINRNHLVSEIELPFMSVFLTIYNLLLMGLELHGCARIGRSVVRSLLSMCWSILVKDTEPQTDPDTVWIVSAAGSAGGLRVKGWIKTQSRRVSLVHTVNVANTSLHKRKHCVCSPLYSTPTPWYNCWINMVFLIRKWSIYCA